MVATLPSMTILLSSTRSPTAWIGPSAISQALSYAVSNLFQLAPDGYTCFCNWSWTNLVVIYSAASKTIHAELGVNTSLSKSSTLTRSG